MIRLFRAGLVLITGMLALMLAFSAIACHMEGHVNRWWFTVAALLCLTLFIGVTNSKDLT